MRTAFLVLTILVASLSSPATRVSVADQLVKIESAPFLVGQIQRRLAKERGETPQATTEIVNGYLSKPDGDGPFPAVVYLHGCDGLFKSNRDRVSERFTGWGYVSLAVDSFTTRGIKEACDGGMPNRQGDAWGALTYLSKLSFVDPRRIAVVGSSQGGKVALELASGRSFKLFNIPEQLQFKAAVAFYPICSLAAEQLTIPSLILIGELDDWASAEACERWMELRAGKGASVKLTVFPGAYHAFDVPSLGDGKRIFGHWLKYDADAAARSSSEMHDFLASQLAE